MMTDVPVLGQGTGLAFHGPMSEARADQLAAELAAANPLTVLDLGCGWGELLLRVLHAAPAARGTGVDIHGPDLARGRESAAAKGLSDRITFIEGPAREHLTTADLVMNVGASHAFGEVRQALESLREATKPGGRLLFGAQFWEAVPTPEQLARMWPGTTAEESTDLAGLVELATAAGFRPLRIATATAAEWEEFESGFTEECEDWLIRNGDHPAAAEMRETLDRHRGYWLRGYRKIMGFAYLILG